MFTNDTDLFMTRVENPTDKPFCHRGLPGYPVVPAKGYIDIKGVYTRLFRDEWYKKAIDAGMVFTVHSIIKCVHVADLKGLPVPEEYSKADKTAKVDPDSVLRAEPDVVMPTEDALDADAKLKHPFRDAAKAAQDKGENLPAGVARLDDLKAAMDKHTVTDAQVFKKQTEIAAIDARELAQTAPAAETEAEVINTPAERAAVDAKTVATAKEALKKMDSKAATPAAAKQDSQDKSSKGSKGGKAGKARSWSR